MNKYAIYLKKSCADTEVEIAVAVAEGRENRASGILAYHVLDVMHAFQVSPPFRNKPTWTKA